MFGLSIWKLVAVAVVLASIGAGLAALRNSIYHEGEMAERAKWESLVAEQNLAAAQLLTAETEKVRAKERELAALKDKVETDHAVATAALAAAGAKYNRLGLVFERTRAGCRSGGDGADGTASTAAAGDPERQNPGANVPGPPVDTLGDIARDADQLRVDFKTCQDYVRALPGVVNTGR